MTVISQQKFAEFGLDRNSNSKEWVKMIENVFFFKIR